MSDAVIVGDVHLSDRAPSSRKDSYVDEILAKLEWCALYANHPGPGQGSLPLIFAGDIFHIKTPWRTSYGLVQRLHDILATVTEGVWIVPGNHDLSHDRLESLDSQPLGALCRMGNVHPLIGWDEDLPGVVGIPWQREFDGGDWKSAVEKWAGEFYENSVEPDLLVTHAPLFPEGKEPGVYASIPSRDWAALMSASGVAATYYGHIHEQHGVYGYDAGHTLCNNGAISRGSIHEESINRWPTITQWSAQSRKFYDLPLPKDVVKPPEEVFLFEKAAEQKVKESLTAAFEGALGEVRLTNLTTEEVLDYVRREDVPPKVLGVIEEVLESVL